MGSVEPATWMGIMGSVEMPALGATTGGAVVESLALRSIAVKVFMSRRSGSDAASPVAAADELDAGVAVSARLDLGADSDGRRCQEGPCGQKRGGRKGNGH